MAIFKGKHFFWSLFLIKLQPWRKKLQYRYLPKNIVSFLRTGFFKEHVWWKTRLVIFPMSRNYIFETYFADTRFWRWGCDALSPQWSYGKKLLRSMKQSQMILCLILFPALDWTKLKEQIAERRNFPEISIYQANLYKQ